MLSILIPVYNYDVRKLISVLHDQGMKTGEKFEIICIDDCSNENFRLINKEISSLLNVKYSELHQNKGRSAIRNLLAENASFEWILFMDCDVMPESENFIAEYLKNKSKDSVIYGGRSYSPVPPDDPEKYFHWFYGTNREVVPFHVRQIHPYRSFMTNNFMMEKELFLSVKMNEGIQGYGHEDTLFGYELKEKNIPVQHINNPLRHLGLENTDEFIAKTKNGIRNFFQIIRMEKADADAKLYRAYRWAKYTGTKKLIVSWYHRRENKIMRNLKSSHPKLWRFDLMKLALLLNEEMNQRDH